MLAAVLFLPLRTGAVSATSAYVLDAVSGRVLFSQNPDRQSLIASTTKIMTALIICEQCNVLDRMRIPKEAVGIEGSSMYLKEGEVFTLQELLYGLMLSSGNDAAVTIAENIAGSEKDFAELMNKRAAEIGCKNSHFSNPHGLHYDEHYTTAYDLALIAAEALKNETFAKIVSTREKTLTNCGDPS